MMIGVPGMTGGRRLGKIEKPRPLKMSTINSSLNDHSNKLESVLTEMDAVSQQLNSTTFDRNAQRSIFSLCEDLKIFGPQLENVYKDQLDRCYVSIRNGCRDDRISLHARYRLLEVLELRAMQWHANENHTTYYKQKLAQYEVDETEQRQQQQQQQQEQQQQQQQQQTEVTPTYYQAGGVLTQTGAAPIASPIYPPQFVQYPNQHVIYATSPQSQPQIVSPTTGPGTPPSLAPGEVVKSSGKFLKPTRVPGKNYCKDEVVIRNADSGKVMGLKGRRVHMIEELSETIISFQRVAPGARERLVQITGPSEDNISHAKQLIEETIRRNASPVRADDSRGGGSIFNSLGGSSSSISSHNSDETLQANKRNSNRLEEPIGEYRYTVAHGNEVIRITGCNIDLVRTAKLILDEYFNSDQNLNNIDLRSPDVESGSNTAVPPLFPSPPSVEDSDSANTGGRSSSSPPSSFNANPKVSSGGRRSSSPVVYQDVPPKTGVMTVLRQPLLPSSTREIVENVEKEIQSSGTKGAISRRALFAKTSDERSSSSSQSQQASDAEACSESPSLGAVVSSSRILYTREFLLKCTRSPLARLTPNNWAWVVRQHPAVVKKSWQYLPKLEAKMTEKGEFSLNATSSYLQETDFISADDYLEKETKWSLLRSASAADEEETANGI